MSFEKHLPALADALRDVAASVGTDTMGLTLMFPNETTFSSNFHQDLGDLTKDPVLRDLLIRNSALRAAQAAVRADGVEKTAAHLHLERGEVEAVWFENPAMDSDTSAVGPIRVGRKRRGLAPVVALTDERAANDHAEIARLLAGHGHTAGFTPEEIARAEAKRKVRFPDELRLFFSSVRKGTVLDQDEVFAEVVEGLTAGTGVSGNVVDPVKRWGTADTPLPTMPRPTPGDVVQPAYATPGWIVFAVDGGGNAYALDTVPGPKGRIGQVVQFNHELDDPPELVAWSLTDFLAGRFAEATGQEPRRESGAWPTKLILGDHVEKTSVGHEEGQAVEELHVTASAHPIDLRPFLGSASLKVLTIHHKVARPLDLGVLRTLTALEHLEAPAWAWREIAELDAWPPSLVTLDFAHHGGDALTDVATANVVLAHYGKPPIETHTWRG